MLNRVLKDYQDYFLVVLSQASEYLKLIFGLEVKEVDQSEQTYILVPTLGLHPSKFKAVSGFNCQVASLLSPVSHLKPKMRVRYAPSSCCTDEVS